MYIGEDFLRSKAENSALIGVIPRVIEAALSYAYTGAVEMDMDIAVRLFLFSYNIGCAEIRAWCVDFLSSRYVWHLIFEMSL